MPPTSPAGDRPAPRRLRRAARLAAPTLAAFSAVFAFAAFTDEAQNAGNRASAADVSITEDVAATAPLFALDDWQPGEEGDTVARCIGVTNDGSIPLAIRLRLAGTPTGSLGDFVDLRVVRGTRDRTVDSSSCATFAAAQGGGDVWSGELSAFPTTTAGAVADGGAPLPVDAERAYAVTWKLQDTEAAEGLSVSGVTFRWETSSAE